jgi:FKBP-type peptidyl-prolyl cis-trans isomerase
MQDKKGNIGVIASFVIVVCLIGLIVYALLHTNPSDVSDTNKQIEQTIIGNDVAKEQNTTPTKNMEQKAKNGLTAQAGDTLVMNYTGKLTNGTIFDSNVDPKFGHVQPFTFTLGAGQVIKGWDEGLVGMKVGEKKKLTISPEKGYGAQAVGSIPANSTLIFDVELVAIK